MCYIFAGNLSLEQYTEVEYKRNAQHVLLLSSQQSQLFTN